jgi:hypothetical protein
VISTLCDDNNGPILVITDSFEEVARRSFIDLQPEINLRILLCEKGGKIDLGKSEDVGHIARRRLFLSATTMRVGFISCTCLLGSRHAFWELTALMFTNRVEQRARAQPDNLSSPAKQVISATPAISGLPVQNDNGYPFHRDIHMNTAKGPTTGLPDIRMATAKGYTVNDDIIMDTAKAGATMKQIGLPMWQRELLQSPEVKRKATVAQLCK